MYVVRRNHIVIPASSHFEIRNPNGDISPNHLRSIGHTERSLIFSGPSLEGPPDMMSALEWGGHGIADFVKEVA